MSELAGAGRAQDFPVGPVGPFALNRPLGSANVLEFPSMAVSNVSPMAAPAAIEGGIEGQAQEVGKSLASCYNLFIDNNLQNGYAVMCRNAKGAHAPPGPAPLSLSATLAFS